MFNEVQTKMKKTIYKAEPKKKPKETLCKNCINCDREYKFLVQQNQFYNAMTQTIQQSYFCEIKQRYIHKKTIQCHKYQNRRLTQY